VPQIVVLSFCCACLASWAVPLHATLWPWLREFWLDVGRAITKVDKTKIHLSRQ
jgi:hypothetical protein